MTLDELSRICLYRMAASITLIDFSDCLLLQLLSFMDATSLYNLSLTCHRLNNIIKHKTLWRWVDCRRSPNKSSAKVQYCLKRCTEKVTKTFLCKADRKTIELLPRFKLPIDTFRNLTILALEKQRIAKETFDMKALPIGLEELSLRHTLMVGESSSTFFRGTAPTLSKLRVLVLDDCPWMTAYAFMSMSKYDSLEVLSLLRCRNVENSLAYFSLSRLGFNKLKVLDVRFTPMGNDFLRGFADSPSLLAIYVQSTKLSELVAMLLQKDGDTTNKKCSLSDEENERRRRLTRNLYRKQQNDHINNNVVHLDNSGLSGYNTLRSDSIRTPIVWPSSVLYRDPYAATCTCHESHDNNHRIHRNLIDDINAAFSSDDDDSENDLQDEEEPSMRRKRRHLSSLSNSNRAGSKRARSESNVIVIDMASIRMVREQQFGADLIIGDIVFEPIGIANRVIPLRRLSLRGQTALTGDSLQSLRHLELDVLDLTYTKMSQSEIAEYQLEHPNCRILHEAYCTCGPNK